MNNPLKSACAGLQKEINKKKESPFVISTLTGNHTVEKRRRGEEKHVPSGRHRLPEVRGLGRFRERPGAGRQGGERVAPPSFRSPANLHWTGDHLTTVQTSGEAAVLLVAVLVKKI